MKENKSPGVDGISPQILKETVEQMCTPLAHVYCRREFSPAAKWGFRDEACFRVRQAFYC